MLFVISAPSGAGKTTIIKELFRKMPEIKFSVSATTRKKRKDETNGVDYYFISREEFENKIKRGEFVEWEEVHGNLYGTLKREIEKGTKGPRDLVFEVDVKGAISIKNLFPQAVTIFIDAPKKDLISRLKQRKTDTEKQIRVRTKRMKMEQNLKKEFEYIVMNRTNHLGVEQAVNQIINIIKKEKNKKK